MKQAPGICASLSFGALVVGIAACSSDPTTCAGQATTTSAITTLATGQLEPYALAVDATDVYWTDMLAGQVVSVPIAGGAPRLIAKDLPAPADIALHDGRVYCTNLGTIAGEGSVVSMPLDGSGLAVVAAYRPHPYGIAVDDQAVYWTNFGHGLAGTLERSALQDRSLSELVSGQSPRLALAIDTNNLYWTTFEDGSVWSVGLGGGEPTLIADNQNKAWLGLAVDDTDLYWTATGSDDHDGALLKAPKTGGQVTSLSEGLARPAALTLDDTYVYWTNSGDGTVMRLPKTGGAPEIIADDQETPWAIAVDAANVYWTVTRPSMTDGAVRKRPK